MLRPPRAPSASRPLVGEAEQLDRTLDAPRVADRHGHPAGVRQHVMRSGAAGRDQLVAHPARERQVGDPVTVQMPELAAADAELDAAEAMRTDLDLGHDATAAVIRCAAPDCSSLMNALPSRSDIQGRPEPSRPPLVIGPTTHDWNRRSDVGRYGSIRGALQPAVRRPRGAGVRGSLCLRGRHCGLAIGVEARNAVTHTRRSSCRGVPMEDPAQRPRRANSAEEVETATRIALNNASTERERMEALRSLGGVEFPTASVLLHLACPERYTILDKRALHALGADHRPRTASASGPNTSRSTGGCSRRPGWMGARSTARSGNGRASRACLSTEPSDGRSADSGREPHR